MRATWNILRIFVKAITAFISCVMLYFGLAFVLSRISIAKEAGAAESISIYIKTNGVHTDIVVPVRSEQIDWSKDIKFSHTLANDNSWKYVGMGWGDKEFYLETPTWADLKISTALKATFALGTAAMHTSFYHTLKEDKSCKHVRISTEQYERLIKYLLGSFEKTANNQFINIPTKAVYGGNDAFYEASGSFNLFKTCNTWANNALKACGQKSCVWTVFKDGIFRQYE